MYYRKNEIYVPPKSSIFLWGIITLIGSQSIRERWCQLLPYEKFTQLCKPPEINQRPQIWIDYLDFSTRLWLTFNCYNRQIIWLIVCEPSVNFLKLFYHIAYLGLTYWGWDKMDVISQTTFSMAFLWMKIFEFRLKFHWNLFLRVH